MFHVKQALCSASRIAYGAARDIAALISLLNPQHRCSITPDMRTSICYVSMTAAVIARGGEVVALAALPLPIRSAGATRRFRASAGVGGKIEIGRVAPTPPVYTIGWESWGCGKFGVVKHSVARGFPDGQRGKVER